MGGLTFSEERIEGGLWGRGEEAGGVVGRIWGVMWLDCKMNKKFLNKEKVFFKHI